MAERKDARDRLLSRLHDRGGGRGLWGAEFTDLYGADVKVSDSSSAEREAVWLFVDGGEIANTRDGKQNSGSILLSREQAGQLAEVLLKFERDGSLRPAAVLRGARRGNR